MSHNPNDARYRHLAMRMEVEAIMSEHETSDEQHRAHPPKSEWGPGPWQDEPDRFEWRHKGVPCLALRGPWGAWCGYVAAEPGHPWHGHEPDAEVHGDVTFTGTCSGHICHVPEPGEPDDVWWLGFDCAHAFDLQPGMGAYLRKVDGMLPERFAGVDPFSDGTYRDLAYVRAQCEQLADQLIAARAQ